VTDDPKQPGLELIRVRIAAGDFHQELPLEGQPDRVGRGIALSLPPPAIGGVHRRQELATDGGRAQLRPFAALRVTTRSQ